MWSLLALALASLTRQPASGLVLALVLWLVIVLVIPQIGDTMDPDNQIPGGLFASLQIDATNENALMTRFASYETWRDFVEQTSTTKQASTTNCLPAMFGPPPPTTAFGCWPPPSLRRRRLSLPPPEKSY
jgi:hypothetical protein